MLCCFTVSMQVKPVVSVKGQQKAKASYFHKWAPDEGLRRFRDSKIWPGCEVEVSDRPNLKMTSDYHSLILI